MLSGSCGLSLSSSTRALIAITLVLIGLQPATLLAVTSSWNINTNGQYTTDANWNNGISPEAGDIAVFDRGSGVTYTVTFAQILGADIVTDRLVVGSNTVTFNPGVGAPDYILDNTTTIEADPILGLPVRGITIGAEANDTAAVLISHLSLLEAVAATLGHATSSSGTLTLDQNNDLFNVTGGSTSNAELIIGRLGTGVLNVSAGADITVNGLVSGFPAGTVVLGRASSGQGTANISGAGSTLDLNTALTVGESGTGTLNVTTGGRAEDLTGLIANLAGSNGTANITGSGSIWSNTLLFVGEFGQGTLNITGGGVVESQDASIAGQSSSTSTATVSGAGSAWNLSSGIFHIGLRGNATLNITDGGHVNSVESIVGDLAGSDGSVTVSGAGSLWASTNTLYVGNRGTGSLDVTDGGQVTTRISTYIGFEDNSTGTVTVDGAGSSWIASPSNLYVGVEGDGTMEITGGGQVTAGGGLSVIGYGVDSASQVTVDGAGSRWINNHSLVVGYDGDGTLEITGGGDVSNVNGIIGFDPGSTGAVLVDGPGSLWTVTGDLFVGNLGQGTLTVQNGGLVDVDGNVNINTSSTATLQAAAVGGNVANNGQMNLRGNAQIGGSLTVGVDADMLIQPASPCCGLAVEVGGSVANSGTFTMQVDSAEPCCAVTLDLGAGQTFTNNATGVVNLNGPADAGGSEAIESKHIIGGNVVNSGEMNVRTNAQITGSMTTSVDAETIIDPATPCCGMVLDVAGPVTNSGTFTVRNSVTPDAGTGAESGSGSSNHQEVTLIAGGGVANSGTFTMQIDSVAPCCGVKVELGTGQTFTNNATGVVNLNGPTDVDEGETIESKHIIAGSVVNSGQLNVRGNTQIEGSLTIAVNAETIVDPQEPCCSMALEVAGPVANSGTFEMMADSIQPCCSLTVAVGAGETFTNNASGVVRGTGVIDADVLNHGQVQPGHSPGVLTIAGDYTQASDGRLVVDIEGTNAGSEYDQLAIGGEISLDGVVEVIFGEDFAPQVGNRFEIIATVEPINDNKFAGASLPGLPEGMDWGIHYGANEVALAISIPGDYSGNGTVDAADYVVWRKTLGQTGVFLAADGNGNDEIDAGDYDFWKMHFGETVLGSGAGGAAGLSSSGQAAVPEPATGILVLSSIGFALVVRARCRRK